MQKDSAFVNRDGEISGLDPEYVFANRNLSRLYLQMERFEEATFQFDVLIEMGEATYDDVWGQIQALKGLKRFDEALKRLEELSHFNQTDSRVYREMGMIYLHEKGDMASARQYFARSLQLNPNQPDVSAVLGAGLQQPNIDLPGSTSDSRLPRRIPGLPTAPEGPALPQHLRPPRQ